LPPTNQPNLTQGRQGRLAAWHIIMAQVRVAFVQLSDEMTGILLMKPQFFGRLLRTTSCQHLTLRAADAQVYRQSTSLQVPTNPLDQHVTCLHSSRAHNEGKARCFQGRRCLSTFHTDTGRDLLSPVSRTFRGMCIPLSLNHHPSTSDHLEICEGSRSHPSFQFQF
jgi:hypothetical protein